ncbi:hypothetical protein DFH11DRAFT_1879905 [Phellopilus nigrolimitatus]|nr:hypothetical protein DFH11DRAFT_1879905 [Phellopilus nigrolimitatus]
MQVQTFTLFYSRTSNFFNGLFSQHGRLRSSRGTQPSSRGPHAREPGVGLDAGAQRGAYTPMQMQRRQAALVKTHFLVFVCLLAACRARRSDAARALAMRSSTQYTVRLMHFLLRSSGTLLDEQRTHSRFPARARRNRTRTRQRECVLVGSARAVARPQVPQRHRGVCWAPCTSIATVAWTRCVVCWSG